MQKESVCSKESWLSLDSFVTGRKVPARPDMRFVPVKSDEQQAVLCLHRIRHALIKERTAAINQLRGLLSEFGLVMPQGRYPAQHHTLQHPSYVHAAVLTINLFDDSNRTNTNIWRALAQHCLDGDSVAFLYDDLRLRLSHVDNLFASMAGPVNQQ